MRRGFIFGLKFWRCQIRFGLPLFLWMDLAFVLDFFSLTNSIIVGSSPTHPIIPLPISSTHQIQSAAAPSLAPRGALCRLRLVSSVDDLPSQGPAGFPCPPRPLAAPLLASSSTPQARSMPASSSCKILPHQASAPSNPICSIKQVLPRIPSALQFIIISIHLSFTHLTPLISRLVVNKSHH